MPGPAPGLTTALAACRPPAAGTVLRRGASALRRATVQQPASVSFRLVATHSASKVPGVQRPEHSLKAGTPTVASLLWSLRAAVVVTGSCLACRRVLHRQPQRRRHLRAEPAEAASSSNPDAIKASKASQRLLSAESTLRKWSYVSEVVYTWLGLISFSVASFAAYSQGGLNAFRSSMGLGLASVALSVTCALVGWFQARSCRNLGRRCGIAANSLEPGGPVPPASQLGTILPSLASVEASLRARQRTAWLGALFAVVGLQSMVGLMVAKVLATSGGLGIAPGINLDIFTLLAVGNAALSHILGGGAAALQQASLPQASRSSEDSLRGWA